MAKLWQRSREAGKERELVETDLSNILIDKPTVIFLPGIFTTHKKKNSVAEGLDEIETLLKGNGVPLPDIYGMPHNDLANIFNLAAYNGNPDRAFSRSARQMAEALILPLVTKDGKPLPEEEAAQNLRNLTLVGYSAGTVFGQELLNASIKLMKQAGYKEARARHLLGEVVLISMANVSRPSREKDRFTTLHLASPNDMAVRLKNRIWRPLARLFHRHSGDFSIRKLSQRSLLVTARISRDMHEWRRKPDGTKDKRAIKPLLPPKLKLRSNHEMPHYMTCDDAHNGFSRLVLNSLVNAIRRNRRLDVTELLEPVNSEEETSYRSRLEEGFRRGDRLTKRRKRGTDDHKKSTARQDFPAPPALAPAQPRAGYRGGGAVPV